MTEWKRSGLPCWPIWAARNTVVQAFFRHRKTGFETVDAQRFDLYKRALENDVKLHGLPDARYVKDGGPLFDRTATVRGTFNQLVIYRGYTLHCRQNRR